MDDDDHDNHRGGFLRLERGRSQAYRRQSAGAHPRRRPCSGLKTTVFLEFEGAAHYLPAYASNLDIMTLYLL
jgi:acetaldehyde dehydrogenase (acetylating)